MKKWLPTLLLILSAPALSSCVIMTGDDRAMSHEGKAVVRIARKLMFKKIRSEFKSQLEDQFRADPSMSYHEFERQANIIHNLGRKRFHDYETERLRERVLLGINVDKERRGHVVAEDEVDLIRWGPFIVDDEGSVKFNPLVVFNKKKISDLWIHAADDCANKKVLDEPLLKHDDYKIKTKLRVNFNPMRAVTRQDISSIITKYRLVISTEHYTDVTHRRQFVREYEFSYDTDDDIVSFFFNFVIPF